MANPKIFVFAPADQPEESHARLEKFGCELTVGEAGWHSPQGDNEDDMVAIAKDAVALMGTSIRSSPITRRIMEANPELRIVAKCTVGTDDIDVDAATEMGILVTHAPTESNCYGVAEGTVAMILARMKMTTQRDAKVKAGGWRDPALMGRYLGRRETDGYPGLTLGIIGVIESFGLFWFADTVLHIPRPTLQTIIFLKLLVAGHLTIYVTRNIGWFWQRPWPNWRLIAAAETTQIIGTLAAVYGWIVEPIGWGYALLVWGYALVWFVIENAGKIWVYRTLLGGPSQRFTPRLDAAKAPH